MGSSEPRPPWCAALAIELLSEAFVPVVASSAARAADSGSRARPFDAVADPLVISAVSISKAVKKRRLAVSDGAAASAVSRIEPGSAYRPAEGNPLDCSMLSFGTAQEWGGCGSGSSSPRHSTNPAPSRSEAGGHDRLAAAASLVVDESFQCSMLSFGTAQDWGVCGSGSSSPGHSTEVAPSRSENGGCDRHAAAVSPVDDKPFEWSMFGTAEEWGDFVSGGSSLGHGTDAVPHCSEFPTGADVPHEPPPASGALSQSPIVLANLAAAASPENDAATLAATAACEVRVRSFCSTCSGSPVSGAFDVGRIDGQCVPPAIGSPLAACIVGDLPAGIVGSVRSKSSGGGDLSAAPACQRMPSSAASSARPAVSVAGGGDSVVVRGVRGAGLGGLGTDGFPVAIGSPVSPFDRVTRIYQMFKAFADVDRADRFGLGTGACLAPRGLTKVLMKMRVAGKSMVALGAGNSSGRVALAAWVLGAARAVELEHVRGVGSSLPPANHAQQELFGAVRRSQDFEALCLASKVMLLPYDGVCRLEFRDLSALAGVPEGMDAVFLCGIGIDVVTVRRLLTLSARCDRARVLGVLVPQLDGLRTADDVLLALNCPSPGCNALVGGAWLSAGEETVGTARALDAELQFSSAVHVVWIFERSAPVPDSAAPLAAGAPSGQGPGPAVPPRAALAGQAGCGGAASVWKPVEPAAFSTREALRAAVELWCSDRMACYSKFGLMERWDTSRVCDMSSLFADLAGFNDASVGDWDVSSVRSMRRMFDGAVSFNAPLGKWDVSRVEDMSAMFRNARAFDQPLGGWDVGRVTSMQSMFEGAVAFNRPLAKWIVSSVTDMRSMFRGAVSFNRPLAKWDVSSVIDMRWMFCGAVSFNQPLSKWDVSSVLFAIGLQRPSEEACECQCECIAQRRYAAPYARVLVAPPRQGWRDIPSFGALPWVTMCDACYEHLEARRDADGRPGCYCVVRFSSLESGPRALGAVLRRSSVSTEAGQLATALGVACGGGSKSLIQGGRIYCSTGITKSKADKTRSARDDAMWAEQMLDVLFLICVLSGLDALPPPSALSRFGRFGREFVGAIGPKDMQCPHFDWMAAGVFQVITMLRAASRATLVFNAMRTSDLFDCELTYGATAEQLADPLWRAAVERFASVLHAAEWARAVKQIPLAYGDLAAGDVSILAADTAHAGPGVPEGETRQVHAALCSLSLDTALLRAEPKQMQALEVLARLGLPRLVADCDGDEPLPNLLKWATEEFLQFVSQKTVAGPWSAADFRRLKKRLKKGRSSESFLTQLVAKSWRAFLEQPDFWD